MTGRVDLAPAHSRQEVVRRACAEQLAATCALRDREGVVVGCKHVTIQTTSCRLVVYRVPDTTTLYTTTTSTANTITTNTTTTVTTTTTTTTGKSKRDVSTVFLTHWNSAALVT